MKYFLIPFALLLLFSFESCDNSSKYKTELAEILDYNSKLDSLQNEINGIDFDSLVYMQEQAKNSEVLIRQYYAPDTIDMEFAKKLNKNKGVHKSLTNVLVKKDEMTTEVDALKLQFSNLESDILNGIYSKEQMKDYITTEKLDYDILALNLMDFMLVKTKMKSNFYDSNSEINQYLESIMNDVASD